MKDFDRFDDESRVALETAERQFGQAVRVEQAGERQVGSDSEARAALGDRLGRKLNAQGDFQPIDLDIIEYPNSPILGRLVLLLDIKNDDFKPAMLIPRQNDPNTLRLVVQDQPYDPQIGVSKGINFGLSVEAETQAPTFGDCGQGGSFEGGHFGVVLTSGASDGIARSLAQDGDRATHRVLEPGLPGQMSKLGLLDARSAPRVIDIDTTRYNRGQRYPLHWHPSLEGESGPVSVDYPDATRLMLGAGIRALGQSGLDRAERNLDNVIRGADL